MSRGNRKAAIFDDDLDRERFLDTVKEASARYDAACQSYCLMSNHYHLVMNTPSGNLSSVMHFVNGVYTQASNRRHQRTGHVFEGRFVSLLIDNDTYLRDANRYVVRNPIEAGLVKDAADWKWSSYRATAGLEPAPDFLSLDWLDWVFGGESKMETCLRYQRHVMEQSASLQPDLNGLATGTPVFEAAVRAHIGSTLHRAALPRRYRALGRPTLAEIFGAAKTSRGERDSLILRAHIVHGYKLAEIAVALALHPNSVSKRVRAMRNRWRQ
jgi:REP element-mobilizing transposase RayT